MTMDSELFRDIALSQIPRILGFGDRSISSKTFGCFDRFYWHYRLIDFPNERFQEVALLLGLLYRKSFPGNIYFGKGKLAEWADGIWKFWITSRNPDGSVNEAYPNERSFCATAFSSLAITETLLLHNENPPVGIERTADWLSQHDNPIVSNQQAAAGLSLQNFYILTGNEAYRKAGEKKMNILLSQQNGDGYFPEYGGYDIGYLSITLGLLAQYQRKNPVERISESLRKASRFIERKVEEDGRYEVKGTSRQTQFLYPYGLRLLNSPVLGRLMNGLRAGRVIQPAWLDDRYVVQLTTDYLMTYLDMQHGDDNGKTNLA